MNEAAETLKSQLGEGLKSNVSLRDYVSLKVGGVADYFFTASDIESLVNAVSLANKLKIPYFILGKGCNIVPADAGFPGLVIKNDCSNVVFSPSFSTVIVDSGVILARLINQAAGRDLGGLEFLAGVPSTIGGAIYGNAGGDGLAIGDFVKSVTLLLPKDDRMIVVRKTPDWMNFSYRNSKLKSDYAGQKYKPVILTATLQLVQRRKDEILRLMQQYLKKKRESQPVGELSAGSFFKNPSVSQSAGILLEKAGLKGVHAGGAEFSKKHANYLINRKNATASDIRQLADAAKQTVEEKFDIALEEEIEYIGRW